MVANTLREHLSVGGVEGGFVLPDGFPLADSGVAMGGCAESGCVSKYEEQQDGPEVAVRSETGDGHHRDSYFSANRSRDFQRARRRAGTSSSGAGEHIAGSGAGLSR